MKRGIALSLALAGLCAMLLGPGHPADAQGGTWGAVKGRIVWGGAELPKQMPIEAVKTNADAKACMKDGHAVLDEKWVVNSKNKGLRWTFVWMANNDVKDKTPLPIHPTLKEPKSNKVEIDQPLCAFVPHAMGMREGQVLVAKNSAGVAHNLKWTGFTNPGANILIVAGGQLEIQNLVADRFPLEIQCNIHPWMKGWVGVFNHPYYAVTDADGAFEIKDAPAGDYRLIVWHGSGGYRGGAKGRTGEAVSIKAGGTLDLKDLEFPPPKD
jgi:hypothetical protein